VNDQRDYHTNWRKVALAAGAGFGSLAVCSGAVVAIVFLLLSDVTIFVPSSAVFLGGAS
jgi:hypothetical protein